VLPTGSTQADLLQSLSAGIVAGDYSELRDFVAAHPEVGETTVREMDRCPYDRQHCLETTLRPNLDGGGPPRPFRPTGALHTQPFSSGRLYVGTVANHRARFDMIWDVVRGRIVYLRTLEGYSYFEYSLNLRDHSLDRVDGLVVLRRKTERYEESITLRANELAFKKIRDDVVPMFSETTYSSIPFGDRVIELPDTSGLETASRTRVSGPTRPDGALQ